MAPLHMAAALLALVAAPSEARLLRSGGAAVAGRRMTTSHPVESVIVMLKDLGKKVGEEGQAEEVTYQTFQHWCLRSKKVLDYTIEEEKSTLESLADVIAARQMTIETHITDISALTQELADLGKADIKATTLRNTESQLYTEKSNSLAGTIGALKGAITHLTGARPIELVQRSIGSVIALAGEHLSAPQLGLLQKVMADPVMAKPRPVLKALGDEQDHVEVYDFKSNKVIELLKTLLQEFEADLVKHNQAETNAINAHQLAEAARVDLRQAATNSKTAKITAKGEAEGDLSTAQQSQTSTQSDLDADRGTLSSTKQACDEKSAEWQERSKIRADEAEAIQAAITILAKVTGVRTSAPENPVMPVSPVTDDGLNFFQMPGSPGVKQALELLRQEARVSHSQAISQLAAALAAHTQGPFDQVMNSIQKMVFRLQNEQKEEDDHKNWCDLELSKTDTSIDDKWDKLVELGSKIQVAKSRAVRLANDITAANTMVGTITAHVKEATEIRKTGRDENNLAIKDAEAGQTAVTQAIAVLTTFYKSSGSIPKEDWEFLQRNRAPLELVPSPSTWNGKYVGDAGNTDIISLLKQVSADFASMESDTIAQEESDQNAYEQDIKSCKIEKARRLEESEGSSQERKRVVEKQTSLEATQKEVTKEREAALQYQTDLQPACVTASSTYLDRKSARAAEVTALKAARDHLHNAFNENKVVTSI